MKIQYIQNTYDVDGITAEGEYLILLKDGVPLSYLDLSDTVIEIMYLGELLNPLGVDIEFEALDKVTPTIKKRVNKFLKDSGCG